MWRGFRTVSRIDEMLTDAINGTFVEADYNETELSRLESKFRQYLTAKELETEKTAAERAAIKELVTDISHQTKTPLANVLLYTQLLEEQCRDELLTPYIRQIHMQAEKLEFLIQALVKISRLESGMVELKPGMQPVWPLVQKAAELARGAADAKHIRIALMPDTPGMETANFDFRWTLEALGNLLDNAVKYSPAGSTVTVRVRAFEMFVCIAVEDEGEGIPEQERAQVFERFYRGQNAADKEGSGVGLYLTRMILQKERGYVKVFSRAEGGSSFAIYLSNLAHL